jgi:hypothetical protein
MDYHGYIIETAGMESRCFVDSINSKDFYWVDYGPAVKLETQRQINGAMVNINSVMRAAGIHIKGKKLAAGKYGHLNQYDKCLWIKKIICIDANTALKLNQQ